MSDIQRIIEKHNKLDLPILEHPDLAEDITSLQNYLPQANEIEEKQIKDFMASLLPRIEMDIEKIQGQLALKSETMETIRKNSEACMAYNSNKGQKG